MLNSHTVAVQTVVAIEKRLQLLGRLPQVRIKAWLTKLKQSVSCRSCQHAAGGALAAMTDAGRWSMAQQEKAAAGQVSLSSMHM